MEKKTYSTPQIELIALDKEIALILESNPPLGPDETLNISVPDFFQHNHLKNLQA